MKFGMQKMCQVDNYSPGPYWPTSHTSLDYMSGEGSTMSTPPPLTLSSAIGGRLSLSAFIGLKHGAKRCLPDFSPQRALTSLLQLPPDSLARLAQYKFPLPRKKGVVGRMQVVEERVVYGWPTFCAVHRSIE